MVKSQPKRLIACTCQCGDESNEYYIYALKAGAKIGDPVRQEIKEDFKKKLIHDFEKIC